MDPTNPASSEVPVSTPEKKDGHWITIAAMALFVAAALVAVGFLYYQNQQLKSMLAGYQTQPTPTPVDTTDPTASWKTYTNKALGIEFKYPDHYQVLEDSSSRVTFGFKLPTDSQPSPYLTISNSNSVDLQKVMKTTNCDALAIGQYCLDGGKGWGQESDVLNTTVGGSSSKSFYISGGVDNAYHIVQLTEKQLELKMNVAGGGLDNTFSQILSTFKFLETPQASPKTGWTRYNSKFGYQFDYPSNLHLESDNPISLQDNILFTFNEGGVKYNFYVAPGGRGGPKADQITNNEITIDGKKFTKRVWLNQNIPFFVSIIPNSLISSFNHIEYDIPPTNSQYYLDLFDQIISTFKFAQ